MIDLTDQIKEACSTVTHFNDLKDYSKQIRNNLNSINSLNGPGLYVQFFQNKKGSPIYDANGYSASSHQRPKIIVCADPTSGSIKPGSAKKGSSRIFDYIKHFNLPDKGYEGIQPNTNSKHFKFEKKLDWKGSSFYNMKEVYSETLLFFGWIPTDSYRTAEELEKIWNNSVTECLNNQYSKATFGSSKGTMSETHMLINFEEENLNSIKNQICVTAFSKIEKIKNTLLQ